MSETARPRRRFQFSLRKLLLWMVVVALTFSILSPLSFDGIGWLFVFGWFVAVLVLRWSLGGKWAALASTVGGMLLVGCFALLVYVTASPRPPLSLVPLFLGGSMGVIIGLILFLLVEATCRTIDWLDEIGQSNE